MTTLEKNTKLITGFQNKGVYYLAMSPYKENAILRKFTGDPRDFVADYRKNSTVYMFWVPDVERVLAMDKIKIQYKKKVEKIKIISAYLRAAIYRTLVTSSFKDKRISPRIFPAASLLQPIVVEVLPAEEMLPSDMVIEVEVSCIPIISNWFTMTPVQRASIYNKFMNKLRFFQNSQDAPTPLIEDPRRPMLYKPQWLTMTPVQRACVYETIMCRHLFFKLRPDPVTPFIEDPMRKRKYIRYQKTAAAMAKTYFDWDDENISSRRRAKMIA
jgi:hypothetical protein